MSKLKDYLEQYTKDDLSYFAKKLGVGRISNLKKADLASRIADFMLHPEIMKRRLSILTDSQMLLFEKAIQHPITPKEIELDDAFTLNEMDYGIYTDDNLLLIPDDVKEAYKNINSQAFHEYRKQTSWLMKCLIVNDAFYGIAPVDIIYEMYQKRSNYKIGKDAMLDLFQKIPQDLNDDMLVDGYIVHYKYCKEGEIGALVRMQHNS